MNRKKRKTPVDPKSKCKVCKRFRAVCSLACDYNCKNHCRCGRPTTMTEETVQKLIFAFERDYTVEQALVHAEISRGTFYGWLKAERGFLHKIQQAQNNFVIKSKAIVLDQLHERKRKVITNKGQVVTITDPPNADMALEVLKLREKHRYSPRIEVMDEDLSEVSEESQDKLEKLLKKSGFM